MPQAASRQKLILMLQEEKIFSCLRVTMALNKRGHSFPGIYDFIGVKGNLAQFFTPMGSERI